jgi:2-dehydropantoate 2-reductase
VIQRVCVVGAGAIGSLFAGHLAQIVDVCVLTRRREHADALNDEGLRVSGRSDLLAEVTAAADPDVLPDFDVGIVATKAGGLGEAAAALEGRFADATIMTVLNGLGAEAVVREHGDWPLVSAVTFMSGTKHSDTHVEYILDTATWLGPYEGTPLGTVEEIAGLIVRSGLKAEALPDLRPAQWSKLIFNATVNAVAALTGLPHDWHFAALDDPSDLGFLVRDLVDEGKAVAAAMGVELDADPEELIDHAAKPEVAYDHKASMLQDVEARRATEVDYLNGGIVRFGGEHGVPTPLNEAIAALIKGLEASWTS